MSEGEQLMNDVFDLMCERSADLPPDDPYRPVLAEVLPDFARVLNRRFPLLNVVPIRQEA